MTLLNEKPLTPVARTQESRCPQCATLLTRIRSRMEKGSLSKEQFEAMKKGVFMRMETETKCRKCKRVITTTIQNDQI